jgi:hypothetical protein
MLQPVSRIAFDRRRGYLGVHLQEGALFVDAAWNEGADIAWSLLRDAIIAGGLAGTSGRELRIEPIVDPAGRLINLSVCGTSTDPALPPRPFYAGGLPVLWLADLPIDAQPLGAAFRAEATGDTHIPADGTWIDLLQDLPYDIVLRARVATLDRLDDPFLDDRGLDAPRGTFRKRVIAEVHIRKAGAPRPPATTNLRLSVDGSYRSELNVLYRVELDSLTGPPASPGASASVLWDPDAAATVARVIDTATEGARLIMVDTTEGFDDGFVRFEGPDIAPDLYRVAKAPGAEAAKIQVTRHRCDRAERSLAAWQPSGQRRDLAPDRFEATFIVPAPVQTGDVLRSLPEALNLGWPEAKVVAVAAFDALRNAVTLTLRRATPEQASPRALAIADWSADRPAVEAVDGTRSAQLIAPPPIQAGDVVVALPPSLGTPDTGPWVALKVTPQQSQITVVFGPAGLAHDLRTQDTDRRATLRAPARQFDTTLTVDARTDWTVGMRVSIGKQVTDPDATDARAITPRDERTIARIERVAAPSARPTMLVRLDQPLSNDHAADEDVIPERRIRARRFAGHTCRLAIDSVDPTGDGVASIANFSSALALPDGLSLHLTRESSDGPAHVVRGDGWHFAARSDGWFETRLFAPVEEALASEVALARLSVTPRHHELIDLRPLPAALAMDEDLARIASAATTLAAILGDDPVTDALRDAAALAGYSRVQRRLLQRLDELAHVEPSRLRTSAACRRWLEQLGHAVTSVATDDPTRRQLATIAFAISGLAFAFAAEPLSSPAAPSTPSTTEPTNKP